MDKDELIGYLKRYEYNKEGLYQALVDKLPINIDWYGARAIIVEFMTQNVVMEVDIKLQLNLNSSTDGLLVEEASLDYLDDMEIKGMLCLKCGKPFDTWPFKDLEVNISYGNRLKMTTDDWKECYSMQELINHVANHIDPSYETQE